MAHYSTATLREGLQECFTNIKSPGSFALFEQLKNSPNPGLCLKNGGNIGLPLSERDAEALISASHQAPFGKKEKTIIDESVRRTWQLSPADFELQNPEWNTFLQNVVKKVSAGLGVDATGKGVTAELYKMLLYDKGAMFKPHQDSEKAPRMFGTLVIILPSCHEGGEVVVTHGAEQKVFESSKYSKYDCSYAAWFSDVMHEVKPVRSGRRIVLTYNLIHTKLGSKELAASSNKSMAKLGVLLSSWGKEVRLEGKLASKPLVWLLEHQYTDASLSFDGLKGHDQQVVMSLKDVCKTYDFELYLASLQRVVSGAVDGDEDGYGYGSLEFLSEEDNRTTLCLKRVVNLDGTKIATDIATAEDEFINDKPFKEMDPDDDDIEYTGNEGVNATYFYNRTVAVIVPKLYRIQFLLTSPPLDANDVDWRFYGDYVQPENPKIKVWLNRLAKDLRRDATNNVAQEELGQISEMIIQEMTTWKADPGRRSAPFSGDTQKLVLELAVEFKRKDIFLSGYKLCSGVVSSEMFRLVGVALVRFELEPLLPEISLLTATITKLADRLEMIKELRSGLEKEAKASNTVLSAFEKWLESETDQAILSIPSPSAKDGAYLVTIAKQFASQRIFDKILPVVKSNSNHTSFAMAFITGLYALGANKELPDNVTQSIFKDILSDLTEQFTLQQLVAPIKKPMTGRFWGGEPPTMDVTPDLDPNNIDNLADLILACQVLGLYSELESIAGQIEKNDVLVKSNLLMAVYVPALASLVKKAKQKSISLETPTNKHLFYIILSTHIVQYVDLEPTHVGHWGQEPRSCSLEGCKDCTALISFLVDRNAQTWKFKAAEKRRRHIEYQLYGADIDLRTVREGGSALTLVLTKTRAKYKKAHKEWTQRCNIVRKQLEDIGQPALKRILGEQFQHIGSIAVNELLPEVRARQVNPLQPNENATNRMLPPITKRKLPNYDGKVIVLD